MNSDHESAETDSRHKTKRRTKSNCLIDRRGRGCGCAGGVCGESVSGAKWTIECIGYWQLSEPLLEVIATAVATVVVVVIVVIYVGVR